MEPIRRGYGPRVMTSRLLIVTMLLCSAVVSCTSDGEQLPTATQEPDSQGTETPAPMDHFPVGATGDFGIYPHCGVEFTYIDGMLWRTKPRGNGNPPDWPEGAYKGTLIRPRADLAIYTSPDLPLKRLVFRPAPDAHYSCQ